jgi:MFS family permease
MSKINFSLLLIAYTIAVVYLASTTPISPHEAKLFFSDYGLVATPMHAGHLLLNGYGFGQFLGIRIFFLLIGLLSIFLYYYVARIYLEREDDRRLATAIYMLLPGIITALTLANISILVIPVVLLFLLAYDRGWLWAQALLMLILFVIHDASIVFFISIFLYATLRKKRSLMALSGFFLILSAVTLRGVAIGGRPAGYFPDLFGLYAALFSPLLFIYFFYTMYRILLREEKNILWYISFFALIGSLLLSVRQRVNLTDFAPYVVISVVLMLDTYYKSLRIRLPEYRRRYRLGFALVMSVLVLSSLTIVFHKAFFSLMPNPKKHFAAKLYEPYWLAEKLKKEGVNCYDIFDSRVTTQLRFYGIESCKK